MRNEPSGIASAVFGAAPVTVIDVASSPLRGPRLVESVGANSGAWIPMIAEERVTGVLAVTSTDQKRAFRPDELSWLLSFLEPPLELSSPDEAEAMSAAAAVLRASVDRLEGGRAQADFDRLERARDDVARAFIRRLPELPVAADAAVLPETFETPFRVRAATYSARQAGLYAMRATAGRAVGVGVRELGSCGLGSCGLDSGLK